MMSIVSEKRANRERRLTSGRPPAGIPERRSDERRQTTISDIPYFEWATQFAAFQLGVKSKILEPSANVISAMINDGGRQ